MVRILVPRQSKLVMFADMAKGAKMCVRVKVLDAP